MQTDLFGHEVEVHRGCPLDPVRFSDEEAETIMEDVVYSGMLIEQMASNLKRLRGVKGTTTMNPSRRDAWTDLMWAFDLWMFPAGLPFDTACDLAGADAEEIRSAISKEFGDELRLLVDMIVSRYPDQRQRLQLRLRHYIVLNGEQIH